MATRSKTSSTQQHALRMVVATAVAVVLHVILGWAWSIGGGAFAGWLFRRGGWWRGAVAVGADWALLIGYNLVVAYEPVREMHRAVAAIVWSGPSWTIPAASVLVGAALGLGGGWIGSSLHELVASRRGSAGEASVASENYEDKLNLETQ